MPPHSNSTRTMRYLALYENLDSVREFVASAAREVGLNEKAVFAVQMAVDEGFTNVIEHAYGGESAQENIDVTCELRPKELSIRLRDCGRPFDPDSICDPDLNATLEEREVGGLGLFFIRKLMDEVSFVFEVDAGGGRICNILTMVKRKEKPD